MELKRNVRCFKCGSEITFSFSGNIELQQMSAVGKCPVCGNMLQIDFAVVEKSHVAPASSENISSENISSGIPGLDQAISSELTSDTLKNLME